jgi:hypothetical protein
MYHSKLHNQETNSLILNVAVKISFVSARCAQQDDVTQVAVYEPVFWCSRLQHTPKSPAELRSEEPAHPGTQIT